MPADAELLYADDIETVYIHDGKVVRVRTVKSRPKGK